MPDHCVTRLWYNVLRDHLLVLASFGSGPHAARVSARVSVIFFGPPGRMQILNYCVLIFAASSITQIVIAAVLKCFKRGIDPIRRMKERDQVRELPQLT